MATARSPDLPLWAGQQGGGRKPNSPFAQHTGEDTRQQKCALQSHGQVPHAGHPSTVALLQMQNMYASGSRRTVPT